MKLSDFRNKLERMKGKRQQLIDSVESLFQAVEQNKEKLKDHEEAREVIRLVGQKTQEQLQFHISDITSLALQAIYDDPYELKAEFVQRRNKSECDLFFERNGERIDPLTASGGGAVDVAAFALRIASWSMQRPRSNNVIILDEPFAHLKGEDANKRSLELMQEISKRMKLQILMVADERIPREDLLERVDRAFEVTIHKGVSRVEQIQ